MIYADDTRSLAHSIPYIYFQSWKKVSTIFKLCKSLWKTSWKSM